MADYTGLLKRAEARFPRPPRADRVFHEFTCPIMVDGNLVAEIDLGADITKTYDGHAAFFDVGISQTHT